MKSYVEISRIKFLRLDKNPRKFSLSGYMVLMVSTLT